MRWDITLNQRPFLLDTSEDSGFAGPISVPLLRNQADTAGRPGEGALNREDAWRRVWMSWHHGAGQRVYDIEGDSDPFRFWESTGINPWEKNHVTLLHDVDVILDATRGTPNPSVLVTQSSGAEILVVNDGDNIKVADIGLGATTGYPESVSDFTTITTTSSSLYDMTTDGEFLYATDGSDVYRFDTNDATVGSSWDTLDCQRLWYVMGRLMAANGPDLYNITAPPTSTPLFTHGNSGFEWTSMSAASGWIYAVGHTPSLGEIYYLYRASSEIYRIGIKDDGSGLDVPIPCAALPDGEVAQCILGYAGFVLVGTNHGVRLAQPDANGNLSFGKIVPVGSVWSMDGQDRFVWCGTATDGGTSKLWRLDLSEFTSPLTPAYAEDLVSPTDTVLVSRITSIAQFGGKIVFFEANEVDAGLGTTSFDYRLLLESDLYRTDAYIDLGQVTFGMTDVKTALSGEARFLPAPVGIASSGPFGLFAYWDYREDPQAVEGSDTNIAAGEDIIHFDEASIIGVSHWTGRLKLFVNPWDPLEPDGTPTLTSFTWRARPTPARATEYHLPILLTDKYLYPTGGAEGRNVATDLSYITDLADDAGVTLNIFGTDVVGFVEDFQYQPGKKVRGKQQFDGVLNVKFKVVS